MLMCISTWRANLRSALHSSVWPVGLPMVVTVHLMLRVFVCVCIPACVCVCEVLECCTCHVESYTHARHPHIHIHTQPINAGKEQKSIFCSNIRPCVSSQKETSSVYTLLSKYTIWCCNVVKVKPTSRPAPLLERICVGGRYVFLFCPVL